MSDPRLVCPAELTMSAARRHVPRYTSIRLGLLDWEPGFQRGDVIATCVFCDTLIERAHRRSAAWRTMTLTDGNAP